MTGRLRLITVALVLVVVSVTLSAVDAGVAKEEDAPTRQVPRLLDSVPRADEWVEGLQVVRLQFDGEVGNSTAQILLNGVRKTRRVESSGRMGEVTVRLPKNLPEGQPVKVVISGQDPEPWWVAVDYRAGFRLLRGSDGTKVVSGTDPARGKGGRVVRYTVEVQGSVRRHAPEFLAAATRILADERHGWTARGARRLKRIDNPRRAHIRLLLAKPRLVDKLCARGGVYTGGIYSCWNHEFAALNLRRWKNGAKGFRSLAQYREYLVNHEFGHGLGYGHVRCRGRDKRAPVMEQQSISLRGCRANGRPYR